MSLRRQAFTLLELVLAISLSIALVALLGMAINLHLVRLDSSRSTIEQAQLARSILERIAGDLRSVTMAPSQDVTEQLESAEAAADFDVDEVDQTQEDDEETSLLVESDPAPGINGGPQTITIDRRVMQMSLAVLAPGATPTARAEGAWGQVAYELSLDPNAPGLIRMESHRDTARWREEQGEPAPLATPVASEVADIRFAYFDGLEYSESWEMSEQESLPVAIEVSVILNSLDAENTDAPIDRRRRRTYRRLVRLPAAEDENVTDSSEASTSDSSDEEEA